jgi:hypothetical protein
MKAFTRKPLQIRAQIKNQVFQVKPPLNNVSINDVEDVMFATANMDYKNKKDIFAANGIDYDKVDLYYNKVKQLDYLYDNSENMPMPPPINMHQSMFMIVNMAKPMTKPMFDNVIHYTLCLFRFIHAFIIMVFHSI